MNLSDEERQRRAGRMREIVILDYLRVEQRGRTRLSRACRPADQIEAEDRRTTGRLAMASVDTRAIEGEIDRIRSLGLEELGRGQTTLIERERIGDPYAFRSYRPSQSSRYPLDRWKQKNL